MGVVVEFYEDLTGGIVRRYIYLHLESRLNIWGCRSLLLSSIMCVFLVEFALISPLTAVVSSVLPDHCCLIEFPGPVVYCVV